MFVQSFLPIPPFLGLVKNRRYSKSAVLEGSITLKNPIWDLKWAAVIGGRRYWEGGGIGRRQYWEGGGIGMDDCNVRRQPEAELKHFTLLIINCK